MAELKEFLNFGQSIWLDDIRREYFTSGELIRLRDAGLRGLTSNPSIFENAIARSSAYDREIKELVGQKKTIREIYEALVIADIRTAADILLPVYEASGAEDGFVSLEVDPTLANNTTCTLEQAFHLFNAVGRPNLMIKIPATPAGIPAVQAALAQGININITLLFSVDQYRPVAEAYLMALEERLDNGADISRVASVASFFVSRVDTAVDRQLEQRGIKDLMGKIAIDNSKLAYAFFKDFFAGARWERLSARGARVQRLLWASTSTKNPAYPDTLYPNALIGAHTVNTLPYATIEAVLDHGTAVPMLETGIQEAQDRINRLGSMGVDLGEITDRLQEEGVAAFADSFHSLIEALIRKSEKLRAETLPFSISLDAFQANLDAALIAGEKAELVSRIWHGDHTLWKPDPAEITNRLGWLHLPINMPNEIAGIEAFVEQVRSSGYRHVLLLGMGGSSLAPEVFKKTFGKQPGYLELSVLDSTDPAMVLEHAERLAPAETLYIVSTKSGGTVETISLLDYFYQQTTDALGADQAGKHFIAITDPGSKVAEIGEGLGFRKIFLADPNIGGRYSALSHFGLIPAALVGIDLRLLLQRALGAADLCRLTNLNENPGAKLGAIFGELAEAGRDKLTLITSPVLSSFGDWAEQLIAESTGKDGKGIVPVVGEGVGDPQEYGADRFFVYLHLPGDQIHRSQVRELETAGLPVVTLGLNDLYDLGGQFFLWEFATALAGQRMGIQPFDQPNVEAAKTQARKMVDAYLQDGRLPDQKPVLQTDGIRVFGEIVGQTLEQIWDEFLSGMHANAYISIQAYLPTAPANDSALQALRAELRSRTGLALTTGYGPRFLHSTGQLHKGDAGRGMFVQLTHLPERDCPIPETAVEKGSRISFGILELAQALGDRQALLDRGRSVLRFHIEKDIPSAIERLIQAARS